MGREIRGGRYRSDGEVLLVDETSLVGCGNGGEGTGGEMGSGLPKMGWRVSTQSSKLGAPAAGGEGPKRDIYFNFNVARVHSRLARPRSSPLSSASGPLYAAACHCGPLRVHPSLARPHSTLRSPLLSAWGHPAACDCTLLWMHPSLARAYSTHAIAVCFG